MKFLAKLLPFYCALVLTTGANSADAARSHFETGYVPWGIDEYELFNLSKTELAKRFDGQLKFDDALTRASFSSRHGGPQFILTYKDGKVSGVSRMFIDGAGCHIKGPQLNSKKEALKFSIDGLSELNDNDPKSKKRLESAKLLLKELDGKAAASKTAN
jgi:hypothetical protein